MSKTLKRRNEAKKDRERLINYVRKYGPVTNNQVAEYMGLTYSSALSFMLATKELRKIPPNSRRYKWVYREEE